MRLHKILSSSGVHYFSIFVSIFLRRHYKEKCSASPQDSQPGQHFQLDVDHVINCSVSTTPLSFVSAVFLKIAVGERTSDPAIQGGKKTEQNGEIEKQKRRAPPVGLEPTTTRLRALRSTD
jgi:hypothetical protein